MNRARKAADVSCGTLVVDGAGRLLICHVTGTAKWDIPKGLLDPGEDTLAAAMRELYEEAGLAASNTGATKACTCTRWRPATSCRTSATWCAAASSRIM